MTRLLRPAKLLRPATAGLVFLALGLSGGCGASAAGVRRGVTRQMSAYLVGQCARLPLGAIARDLGESRLVHTAASSSQVTPGLPACGLRPAGERTSGTLVTLVLGFRVSAGAFREQVKYYQSERFSSVVLALPHAMVIYVNVLDSRNPSQEAVLVTRGKEYDVMVGPLAATPFAWARLLKVARLLVGR